MRGACRRAVPQFCKKEDKMEWYVITIIVIVCAAALFCAAMFAFAAYTLRRAFGGRFDKNAKLKYFSAADFGLIAEPVQTYDGNTLLRGYIYTCGKAADDKKGGTYAATNGGIVSKDGGERQPRGLIIFSHGMGPGQCAYTTEIAYFCKNGYAVLAFDCAGCGLSEGNSMRGMEASTRAAVAAADFARADVRLKNLKTFFVGHSMGAYSALCAAPFARPSGVVAFSAPERPSYMVKYGAAPVVGKAFAALLRPFVGMIARMRFKKYGDLSAARQIERSGVPALIVHGDVDEMVPLSLSAYNFARGKNAERMLCRGKGHNPYNTVAAEGMLKQLGAALTGGDDGFLATADYGAICEEDAEVMSAALSFISNIR